MRNRQTWTVTAIGDDGSLTVEDPQRGSRAPARDYVARHVELGWAVTGYGNQGVTVDHGICVVEPASTRAGIYVAMTRGRGRNVAWVVDRTGLEDAEEAFATAIARPPNARTAHAVREQLYRAAGASPTRSRPAAGRRAEDPARRMAERLKQIYRPTGHRVPAEPMSGASRDLAVLSGLVEVMTARRSTMSTTRTTVCRSWTCPPSAERLGVNHRYVRRLVAERRIPFIKFGHLLRFDPAEIEAWLDGARRPPAV